MGHPAEPCKVCHELCLERDDKNRRTLRTSLSEVEKSAERGCPSCAILQTGIALCEPDFRSSRIPVETNLSLLDGYSLAQRIGYSARIVIPGVENPVTFANNDRAINGAFEQGSGLCLNYIYRNGPADRLGTVVELDFFVQQGTTDTSPWQSVRAATAISGDTASEHSFSCARSWLQKCYQDHETCRGSGNSPLPDRVLDLGDCGFEDNRAVRLYETKNELANYVCLSHCWGLSPHLKTELNTLEDRKAGISWAVLPRTFQDAITFTRRLRIRYLWIDSLCIIQNDRGDWHKQSSKLPSIYENSYVTLAATLSSNGAGGCFSQALSGYRARPFNMFDRDGNAHRIFVRRHIPHWLRAVSRYEIQTYSEEFPLLDRAWVLQERLLAPRVLHFGRHELIWECMESTACECSFLNHILKQDTDKVNHYRSMLWTPDQLVYPPGRDALARRWRELVERYSKLKLTFESDKLPALSGLARQINRQKMDTYIAGLWKSSLLEDLLWRVNGSP